MESSINSIIGKTIPVHDANYDNSKMGKEDFLKVLMANFQYQDPFKAQDISQFINDTLNLRQLESFNNFEKAVDTLTSGSSSTLLLQASNLINEKVFYEGDKTYIQSGKGEVKFKIDSDATKAEVVISDQNGKIVEKKTFTDLKGGKIYPFEISNDSLKNGYYNVSIVAKNGDKTVKPTIYSNAIITGIKKDGDNIVALYEYGDIDLNNISQIGG